LAGTTSFLIMLSDLVKEQNGIGIGCYSAGDFNQI
jgi:hypothetical protein